MMKDLFELDEYKQAVRDLIVQYRDSVDILKDKKNKLVAKGNAS
jgi:hypothetical protein